MNEITISVTSLSNYISRVGDISGGSFTSVSGIEGTRLHKRIFSDLKKQYGDSIETEHYLIDSYESDDLKIIIQGRCDCLINNADEVPHIIEIKSFNSTKESYEQLERPEHLTQLKLYGALYLNENKDITEVNLTLRYVSITTLQAYEKTFVMTYEESLEFFDECLNKYVSFAHMLMDYRFNMINSVKSFKFPYPEIRAGQSNFMKTALLSLTSKEALFVEAPTGTGKTISTLYPAIKGLLKGTYHKIFYLTAKAATRDVASKALNDMRNSGLLIRSCLLSSKESMCPYNIKCDSKFCPLAKSYYSRLDKALREILLYEEITPELAIKIAGKHSICPHEFILDAMDYCDVVIGDYNHAFNPRVKLIDSEMDDGNAILIDEAHNLVDRGRDMFSSSFSTELLNRMIKDFKGRNPRIESFLLQLTHYFKVIDQCFQTHQSSFKINEEVDEQKALITDNWEGVRQPPRKFYALLWRTIKLLQPVLDSLEQGQTRETAIEFFFESRYFLTILEQYFDDAYITYVEKRDGDIILTLDCLDASSKIDKLIRDKMSVIFFSATLSPMEYYRNVFIGKDPDYCRYLTLSSPFPPENLEIMLDTSISTTYKNRSLTHNELAVRIVRELVSRKGNYMVFFPSFEYMNQICPIIQQLFNKETSKDGIERKIIFQKPDMSNTEKEEFLNSYNLPFDGTLLGAAVLGGHFSEGIDLVGDKLSGVIIVGVGIPKVTPERQILCNYYTEKFGDGFAFAYRFPGWEKVLQAVGRVIRTENDTGFALILDDRLDKPEYMMLIPEHWNI